LHEKIREHAFEAAGQVKRHGRPNDLIKRIAGDPAFALSEEDLISSLDASAYVGRAPEQTEEFVGEYIRPVLARYVRQTKLRAELSV
ncbi:MAG TPA: adenylosuccinate lyase, partial [Ruminococcaceae bacterium]|nr:adenylosuccinate lyase [Oscillospiraceae bacterium]